MWKTAAASANFMEENHVPPPPNTATGSLPGMEGSRTIPKASEAFGNVPHSSESFRTVRKDAEAFRNIPHHSERNENHTLTVKEASRMFENAGVARTERSIVNWCQPNRSGIARLDAYFDPNERRYYITPQSVELAIAEEKARAARTNQPAETFGKVPYDAESIGSRPENLEAIPKDEVLSVGEAKRIKELERENLDLKITNQGKTYLIEQMQKERDGFFQQVITASRKVGELEAKLLQLEGPKDNQ